MTTMVIMSLGPRRCGDASGAKDTLGEVGQSRGRKFSATTALGMTETMRGSSEARRTVFSLLLMTWSVGGQTLQGDGWRWCKVIVSSISSEICWLSPCVAHANTMIYVTEDELEELVRENARSVGKSKQRVIREYRPQPHCSRMEYALMAKTAQTTVTVNYLYTLSNEDVSQDGEEGENRGERSLPVDDEKGHMVHFQPIGEIAHTFSVVMGVRDDDDLVASVDELAGELVNVRFNASWLWEEEVADHGNVVPPTRHFGDWMGRGLCDCTGVRHGLDGGWLALVILPITTRIGAVQLELELELLKLKIHQLLPAWQALGMAKLAASRVYYGACTD